MASIQISPGSNGFDPLNTYLLLQIRTRVLNGDWEAIFREWYPGFRAAPQPMAA
jgi:hypothetical protein